MDLTSSHNESILPARFSNSFLSNMLSRLARNFRVWMAIHVQIWTWITTPLCNVFILVWQSFLGICLMKGKYLLKTPQIQTSYNVISLVTMRSFDTSQRLKMIKIERNNPVSCHVIRNISGNIVFVLHRCRSESPSENLAVKFQKS